MDNDFFSCNIKKKELVSAADKLLDPKNTFALKDIKFNIGSGEIIGLIGRNGCGKTTLLRMILGLYRIQSEDDGNISLLGCDSIKQQQAYRDKLSFVLTDFPFDFSYTPLTIGKIYGRYYNTFSIERYKELLQKYDIYSGDRYFLKEEEKTAEMTNMSTGELIKTQLAFALAKESSLMVMDEPTGNLDIDFRDELYEEIRTYVSDEEHSVIISSHLTAEIEQIADKLLWIGKNDEDIGSYGYIKFFGTQDELKKNYRIVEADAGLLSEIDGNYIVGKTTGNEHSEALVLSYGYNLPEKLLPYSRYPDLKEIFYYTEKNEKGGVPINE